MELDLNKNKEKEKENKAVETIRQMRDRYFNYTGKADNKLQKLIDAANEKRLKQKKEAEDRVKGRQILVPADLPTRLRGILGKDGFKINK